jgi:signal transduction histidine kinase
LIVGFGVDNTHQELLQNELKQNISSNHELLEYLSTGISIYGPDMRLKYFNHAYAKLTEPLGSFLHSEPTIGEVIEQLRRHRLLPEMTDFQSYKKRQMSLFTSISSPIHELSYLPNGQILRMITAPYPLGGLIFMFEDITERISLESQYNTLIAVQKATIDNLFEGVAVFSSDNRLKISNPSFRRIWKLGETKALPGTHMAQLMDETKDLFFTGEHWSDFKERMIDNITNRTPKMGVIKRLDERVVEFAYVPLPDGANMVRYFDITDTSKVEMALRERNEALETTDRLKSQFVANVSYELRSPLNTVIGFSEIMLNEYFGTLNLKQKEYMHGIYEASKQLLDLINGILDLASIEAGQMTLKKEAVNISKILEKSVNIVERFALEHKHTLSIHISEHIPSIMGDERQLQQVFNNLLSNAIKFTPDNGQIMIKATRDKDTIIVDVMDTGVGIDSKDQSRVFNKFERINTLPQAGVGLGLALVKNFIELHHGTVQLTSIPGKGTTITCRLPLNSGNQIAS